MSTTNSATHHRGHPLAKPLFWLLVALFVFVPLFRAGATPLAALVSQLAALAILFMAFWTPRSQPLSGKELVVVGLLLLLPAAYLVPLPGAVVNALPGRELYGLATRELAAAGADGWAAMSVVPVATASAALALLLPVAVFAATRALGSRQIIVLAHLLIAVTLVQAILGIVQFQTSQTVGSAMLAVEGASGASGTGTYANRNHLAGLIEMALPLTLGLLFYALGRGSDTSAGVKKRWKRRFAFFGSRQGNLAIAYGIAAALMILGVVFTRSRAGISLTMLGILLSAFVFSRRIGGSNVYGLAGTVTVIAIAIAVAIGLAPVLDRFSIEGVADDARFGVFAATMVGIGMLFPIGGGPGTFPEVFMRFQPLETGQMFVNRAHNDYLEWVFDGGALAAILIIVIVVAYLVQWTRVYSRDEWSRTRYLQVGAGIGLFLLALHELVDYNLYTPANQLVFAFLAGVFFMPPGRFEHAGAPISRRRDTRDDQTGVRPPLPAPVPAVPANQIENPFRNP